MTNEPSPRPWSMFVHDEQEGGDGEVSICAGGEWVATMNLRRSTAKDDAALIVDAVNERDRLRDIVRRLADVTHSLLGNYEYRFRDDQNSMEWVKNVRELTREARAAIGEGETPTGKGVGL